MNIKQDKKARKLTKKRVGFSLVLSELEQRTNIVSTKVGYSFTFEAKVGGVVDDYPGEQESGALIFVLICLGKK